MPEIKREPLLIEDAETGELLTCFEHDYTIEDIARWVLKNKGDAEDLMNMIKEGLKNE